MEWKERIRDPKVECMSRDEVTALQSERLIKLVNGYIKMSVLPREDESAWSRTGRYQRSGRYR